MHVYLGGRSMFLLQEYTASKESQTDRQADRQADRQTGRQTDRQTVEMHCLLRMENSA